MGSLTENPKIELQDEGFGLLRQIQDHSELVDGGIQNTERKVNHRCRFSDSIVAKKTLEVKKIYVKGNYHKARKKRDISVSLEFEVSAKKFMDMIGSKKDLHDSESGFRMGCKDVRDGDVVYDTTTKVITPATVNNIRGFHEDEVHLLYLVKGLPKRSRVDVSDFNNQKEYLLADDFSLFDKLALVALPLELSTEQSCVLICSDIESYLKHKWKIKSGIWQVVSGRTRSHLVSFQSNTREWLWGIVCGTKEADGGDYSSVEIAGTAECFSQSAGHKPLEIALMLWLLFRQVHKSMLDYVTLQIVMSELLIGGGVKRISEKHLMIKDCHNGLLYLKDWRFIQSYKVSLLSQCLREFSSNNKIFKVGIDSMAATLVEEMMPLDFNRFQFHKLASRLGSAFGEDIKGVSSTRNKLGQILYAVFLLNNIQMHHDIKEPEFHANAANIITLVRVAILYSVSLKRVIFIHGEYHSPRSPETWFNIGHFTGNMNTSLKLGIQCSTSLTLRTRLL